MNTLFLAVGVLAAIIAGPTDAYTTDVDQKSLVDIDDNTSLVSIHANVEAEKQGDLIKGTVDALLMWDQDHHGIAGNIMMDHEDGTHCVINADPEKKAVEFGAGLKKLSMIYTDDGDVKFVLMDDNIKNKKGKPKRTKLPIGLVVEMMDEALEIGLLDPDVTTILDCAKDFYALYDSDETDERGIGDWFHHGISEIRRTVENIVPNVGGCPITEVVPLAIGLARSLSTTGVSQSSACYRNGIRPAITLFTGGNVPRMVTGVVSTVTNLQRACSGVGGTVGRTISRIQNSCFFNDRRLEAIETLGVTDGTN